MQKTYIFLILISFLFYNFHLVFAQISVLDPNKVPVVDEKAIGTLTNILDTLTSILKLLDKKLSDFEKENEASKQDLLRAKFHEITSDIASDFAKFYFRKRSLGEIQNFLKERQKKANSSTVSQEEFKKAIEEAKIVGAYEGFEKFMKDLKNQFDCLEVSVKDDLSDFLRNLLKEFEIDYDLISISTSTKNLSLDSISDCGFEQAFPTAHQNKIKLNLFSWLIQPFKLNVAQINNYTDDISISYEITPKLKESQDSYLFMNLRSAAYSAIVNTSQEKINFRLQQIGQNWPVEKCREWLVHPAVKQGKALCKNYVILIPGDRVEEFKHQVALNNPLNNSLQSINSSKCYANPKSIAENLQISTSSDMINGLECLFSDVFTPTTTIEQTTITEENLMKEFIQEICDRYKKEGENEKSYSKTGSYAICLDELRRSMSILHNAIRKDIEETRKYYEETQKQIEETIERASNIQGRISETICFEATKDLNESINFWNYKLPFYNEVQRFLSKILSELNKVKSKLMEIKSKITRLIDEIFRQPEEVIKQIDAILNLLNRILGLNLNLNLTKDIFNKLKEVKQEILKIVDKIIGELTKIIDELAKSLTQFNINTFSFLNSGLTSSLALNDRYELEILNDKLDTYERAIERGDCIEIINEGPIIYSFKNNQKDNKIVLNNKKNIKFDISFLSKFLSKIFSPKIVEIRNEK
jgi:hypothetical protein